MVSLIELAFGRHDANRIDGRGGLETAARVFMVVGDDAAALQPDGSRRLSGRGNNKGNAAAHLECYRGSEHDVVNSDVARGSADGADLDRHRHVVARPRMAIVRRQARHLDQGAMHHRLRRRSPQLIEGTRHL